MKERKRKRLEQLRKKQQSELNVCFYIFYLIL